VVQRRSALACVLAIATTIALAPVPSRAQVATLLPPGAVKLRAFRGYETLRERLKGLL